MKILVWVLYILFGFALSQVAAEAEADVHVTSMANKVRLCPDMPNTEQPGASPENPISVGDIAVLYREVDANSSDYTTSKMVSSITRHFYGKKSKP